MKHLLLLLLLFTSIRLTAQEGPYQTCYVIISAESTDYKLLDAAASGLSRSTGIKYDNGGLVWSEEKQLHWPEDSDDEIYAGSYYMRRYDEERISIEMRDWYFDINPAAYSKKMIVVAGIFTDRKRAREQLKKIKQHAPSAYIRTTKIYMGCIH